MAANKEAIAIILDVGPCMNQAPPGMATPLETAIDGINMILQRKIFSESKDEVALILFGTEGTDNTLADEENYQHITLKRWLRLVDFDLLQSVQTDLQPSDTHGDFLDAIVVALDHLENNLKLKKGFGSRRLILFSNLGSPFADQELDTIINAIQTTNTELNVIGPDIDSGDDDDNEENNDKPGPSAGASSSKGPLEKPKSSQQKSGEGLISHILDQVNGECYSFAEALPALSYFQSRQVKPTAWKAQLEIGDLAIPVNGYSKIKKYTLKQTWKKVYAQDTTVAPKNSRSYHTNDEAEEEVEKEDCVDGFRYGNTLVPMAQADKDNMKYTSEKCLKVLGFTKADNVKQHLQLGDGVISFTAEKGDEVAAVALSALINALYETNSVIIGRRVYNKIAAPRLGCLFPHIKAKYECLFWVDLPFAEDIRYFTFGSLPMSDTSLVNQKLKPTDEQLACMDDLITNMDLSKALDDDDGEKSEALKPKLTFNPYFQRLYQCLQHRALNPDEPLPELSPIIASYLEPPADLCVRRDECTERMAKLFKLKVVDKKKDEATGENMFNVANGDGDGPVIKKARLDNDLEGGIAEMTKQRVNEVGSVTPLSDFLILIGRKDKDLFDEACEQMQKRVEEIVEKSFGPQFYSKAMDCLKALRENCLKKSEPNSYNTFIQAYKTTLLGSGRKDFWQFLVNEKQSLITKMECEESGVSEKEAEEFNSDKIKDSETDSKTQEEEETTDDLLMDL